MNRFMALLVISATLLVLMIMVMNFSEKRDNRSRAYQSLGCQTNNQCPANTKCKDGVCIIATPTVTQTPLVYVDASKLTETTTPIPAVYVSVTPTPEQSFIEGTADKINNFFGSLLKMIIDKLGSL